MWLPVGIYIGCGAFLHYHFWYSYITIFGIVVKVSLHVHAPIVLCCTFFYFILASLWGSHFFLMPLFDPRNNYWCLIHLFILFLVDFLICATKPASIFHLESYVSLFLTVLNTLCVSLPLRITLLSGSSRRSL